MSTPHQKMFAQFTSQPAPVQLPASTFTGNTYAGFAGNGQPITGQASVTYTPPTAPSNSFTISGGATRGGGFGGMAGYTKRF